MGHLTSLFTLSALSLAVSTSIFAAKPIDLSHQPASLMQAFSHGLVNLKQTSKSIDFNHTTHIRAQQTYAGYPVWNGDIAIHDLHTNTSLLQLSAHAKMNGTVYENLKEDLGSVPQNFANPEQLTHALKQVAQLYQSKTGIAKQDFTFSKKTPIIYLDQKNKAHWAYILSFLTGASDGSPAMPTYIVDASSLNVYEEWDDIQTIKNNVQAGGYGGNPKEGKLIYDGLKGDYPSFLIQRDSGGQNCSLENEGVASKDGSMMFGPLGFSFVETFECAQQDSQHNNIYWSGDKDAVNEGYSPANDAFYIGQVIQDMYQNWYHLPALSKNGKALKLKLNVHVKDFFGGPMDNAMFFPYTNQMYFGDGKTLFYPLTSLGVGAHEISHGFTSQHSNLTYQKQSGGLNESFSDMAAQAAEYFSTGTNSWQIGPEIVKGEGALRYMDDPTKDGKSIAHVRDYQDDLNVHFTSGVFNKVFYLLGTAQSWDTKKAFDVMVQANMHYWTANETFEQAACGVLQATHDYGYDDVAVKAALQGVGLQTSRC